MRRLAAAVASRAPAGTGVQFVRYLFVGGTAFVADVGALIAAREWGGFGVLGATALAFLAGTSVNYVLSTAWVFSSRRVESRALEFAIFAAVGLGGLLWSELFMWALAVQLGVHYVAAKVFTSAAVLAWNFSARKVALFRDR